MNAPFGGTPGQWSSTLAPATLPAVGYRVIPGPVWWQIVHWGWRQYLAASRAGLAPYQAPLLANPYARGLHLTDKESLEGLVFPEDFSDRLALLGNSHIECQYYGCTVICFDVPNAPVIRQGVTGGGAREWLLDTNIRLYDAMQVTYIDVSSQGPRSFSITL